MNVRVACTWLRDQMIDRALHRVSTPDDQLEREEEWWVAAVAEVDDWLEPPEVEVAADPWSDAEWVAAVGGELAGAG